MATKRTPKAMKMRNSLEAAPREAPAQDHPWLKAYPDNVAWDVSLEPMLLGDHLDQAVAAYGAHPCTYFMGKRLSYAEIGALSDRAAKGLRAQGVGEGVKVGMFMPNTPAFVIFYYGVLKAGGTVVNFNPLYSLEEIECQIRDSGAKIMVTLDLALTYDKISALLERGTLEQAVVVSFTSLLPALKSVGFRLTQRTKLAAIGRAGEPAKLIRAEDLLANDGRFERPAITPDAIAVLQYTGGTTGTPKGAMLSHANLSVNIGQLKTWQNQIVSVGDRIVGVLPLFHVFAMTTVMNFGINHGLEIILLPKFELIPTLKLIGRLRPTMMPGVPTLFNAMLRHPHIGNFDLTSLKYCMAGGAPLPIEVKRGFEAISGAVLVEGYGLSETSPVAACNPPKAPREGSIGLPMPATEISIRSLDDPGIEVKTGETGEICIAGPQVMTGYWNKPQDTEDCFVGRFFRTGDVGYMDQDGYIFIVDRIKDMINASGFKVYPRRIEEALYEHPAVAEVVVIGIKDAYRGEAPKAFVKLTEGRQATAAELIHFLKEKLSKLELPAEIEFRDELPKTLIGKLSKRELRAEAKR